ncbi:putative nucleic acid-binding protein [Helianthus annuus]|nr:putative nucleic acid-binding protein [Helianthus annuus]
MENNQITMFRSLNAHSTNYSIKAKIISMWDKKMNGYDNQIYRVDMLLMDEEGSFIQCSCLHKLFKRFLKFLVVDDCLLIHKPSLAKDTTKIKVTGKDQKLSLYAFMSVLKTDNWSGPRYLEKELSKSSSSKQSCSQVISNTEDEFLNAEDFVLTGFIASIDVKSELVEKDDGSFDVLDDKSFECINPDCDAVDIVPVHRYKIPLRVQDSTGTVSCTLFDYEAIKLLKKTSKELLDIYSKSDVSESNVQCLSESVGNVKGLSKESQSVMGDSVTLDPIDVNDQDPSKFENIKRNLEDVYDVDAVDSSSTKRRNSPGNVEINNSIKLDLITPKIEK